MYQINGLGPTTDAPLSKEVKYHDLIRFFTSTNDRIFEICSPLYENGCSLREIERQTGFAKSSIRDVFNRAGLPMRKQKKGKCSKLKMPDAMTSGTISFGFAYLEGRLVKHPTEYKLVLKIYKLWTSGMSCQAIADYLNNQNIPTRRGKRWGKSVILRIIKRHEEE